MMNLLFLQLGTVGEDFNIQTLNLEENILHSGASQTVVPWTPVDLQGVHGTP